MLWRRHIKVDQIKTIGKESNSLESVEEETSHSEVNAYTEYIDPIRTEWIARIQPALKKIPLKQLAELCRGKLSRRTLIDYRSGKGTPHRKNQEMVIEVLKKLAQV